MTKLPDLSTGTWFVVTLFELCGLFLFPSHSAPFSLPSDFIYFVQYICFQDQSSTPTRAPTSLTLSIRLLKAPDVYYLHADAAGDVQRQGH